MDLTCKDNKCLICDSILRTMEQSRIQLKNCKNRCMSVTIGKNGIIQFFIFGEKCEILLRQKIRQNIEYWKENDRYLAKILEGDS